jgi:pyrroloquinoline quinone (PQQ) biosynthesis protein C
MISAKPFYDQLSSATSTSRHYLLTAPVIVQTLAGSITRELYLAFLAQAYQHVRHTVPLLMMVGGRLSDEHEWLRKEVAHYIEEEYGHEQWILNDIAAAGGDRAALAAAAPHVATDAMIGYAYDTVMRRNPVGFFGMVYVLEGTSIALALEAASQVQAALALPNNAFSYLRSHGTLDREHVQQLAGICNRLTSEADRAAVTTCANAMFWLYGNVFRGLTPAVQS